MNSLSFGSPGWAGQRLSWLAIAAAFLLLPRSVAAAPEAHALDPLVSAKELEKPVTYSETKIPLGELVAKVAADTGAPVAAAAGVADEPVAVVVKELPARELLKQLADLLDYQWSRHSLRRDGGTAGEKDWQYVIWQDLAGRQREEALRQAWVAAAVKGIQNKIGQAAAIEALPPAQLQAMLSAMEERQREARKLPLAEQSHFLSGEDPIERDRRYVAARLAAPVPRVLASFLARLTPQQWATLVAGEPLLFATDPRPGERALPAETGRLLRAADPTVIPPGWHMSDEDERRQRRQELQAQWAAADGYRVTLRLDATQLQTAGWLILTAEAEPLRDGVRLRDFGGGPTTDLMLESGSSSLLPQWQAQDTPERRTRLAKDPVVGAKERFKPAARPRSDTSGPAVGSRWSFRDLLPDLARIYHVDLIADAYWNTPLPNVMTGALPAEPVALFELLDRYASPLCQWDRVPTKWAGTREAGGGRLIRLRSRTWFLERPREVPLRLVRRWKALYDQYGALPLDQYAQMAVELTDAQLGGMLSLSGPSGPFGEGLAFGEVSRLRQALRLYAALSLAQRQTLLQGNPLPVARMTPAQRQLFLTALREYQHYLTQPLGLEQWGAGSFSVTTEPFAHLIQRFGASITTNLGWGAAVPKPGRTPAAPPVLVAHFDLQYSPRDHVEAGMLPVIVTAAGSTPRTDGAGGVPTGEGPGAH